ncbi:M50 family metallopeptidase [Paenibacillus sp. NEAU-GSW1]|uniref:M50 family metallopeptidase n=1 Tax=Paenibacillus sp. NEAU-GSW1 TaxID=2682486 RepID=UPI0012E0EFD6|nr:M50 family metallopeptidase [Paenibacillus sp. NEAU-GSW1]MUT68647.1 M50 family peptidase [Paenibacillus sp. NEAU-GSW1]
MKAWLQTAAVVLVTVVLTRLIPFSAFFRNVDTLVHELGHALTAFLLKGNVNHINLYANQSGVTYMSYAETWMSIPISLAGYMGSALFALLLFLMYARNKERAGLYVTAALAAIGLVLFVRNGYGMLWCAGFAALTAVVGAIAPHWLRKGYYLLIAFICLVESVLSPFAVLIMSFTSPGTAGDAASLSRATFVPGFIWALLFIAFALLCARGAVTLLFKRGF